MVWTNCFSLRFLGLIVWYLLLGLMSLAYFLMLAKCRRIEIKYNGEIELSGTKKNIVDTIRTLLLADA